MNHPRVPSGLGRTPLVRRLPKPAPPAPMTLDRRARRGHHRSHRGKWGGLPLDVVCAWSLYEQQNARANVAYYARLGQLHGQTEQVAA